jgi:hypothetical protein
MIVASHFLSRPNSEIILSLHSNELMSMSIVRLALELSVKKEPSWVNLAISQVSIVPNIRSSVFSSAFYNNHLIFTALK